MPKSVDVTLGGQTFTIQELKSRSNAEWRGQLEEIFTGLATALEGAPGTQITDGAGLAGLVRMLSGMLLRSVDRVGELLVAYAPQVEPALGEAYDSEILEAFTAVLGLAYPFGSSIDRLLKRATSITPRT